MENNDLKILKDLLGVTDEELNTMSSDALVLKGQLVKLQNMYDELLTKYRDEISKRTAVEIAYNSLISNLKAQGVKFEEDEEPKCGEGCNCKHEHK